MAALLTAAWVSHSAVHADSWHLQVAGKLDSCQVLKRQGWRMDAAYHAIATACGGRLKKQLWCLHAGAPLMQQPQEVGGKFPKEAGPQDAIKLPGQTRVDPEEYREFLDLGHGGIFHLDIDRYLALLAGPPLPFQKMPDMPGNESLRLTGSSPARCSR